MPSAIDRLAVVRGHELRRKIMQVAEEGHAGGRLVSPVGLSKQLKAPIPRVVYHVAVLRDAGALRLLDEIPRRGAVEHLYGINEDFLTGIQDSVALDRIAELIEEVGNPQDPEFLWGLLKVVRATGRPVEA